MSIFVVGSTKNIFPEMDDGREKFLVDVPHEGENIDSLNPWYCELTGLYYMWKNSKANIVGLEHYRRFFAKRRPGKDRLTKEDANEILKTHDIIMTTFRHKPNYSAYKWFVESGKGPMLHQFLTILDKIRPNAHDKHGQGLGDAFFEYLTRRELRQCNMFITRKHILDSYCEWLFPLLAAYDAEAGLTEANKRIDGYFAEHIFGLWVELAKLKVYDCPKLEIHYIFNSGAKA